MLFQSIFYRLPSRRRVGSHTTQARTFREAQRAAVSYTMSNPRLNRMRHLSFTTKRAK